ncbi:MAG: hypothetical protein Q9201_005685 [Fulgogasparrea decipioides]
MDPLSVSASIVALLQLTGTVISYLSDVRDGPKELQRIRLEISSILQMLIILQDQADRAKQNHTFCSTLGLLNGPNGPFEQLRDTLKRLASKLAPVEGWRKVGKAFKWPFEKEEVLQILQTIERHKALFSLARQNDHIALSRAISDDIKALHGDINEITVGVTSIQMGERMKSIRRWLSAPDPSSNFNKALKDRHANTGNWFIKSNAFSKWLSESGSPLWLYGIPGCGKTILSSTIIHHTLRYCQSRTDSVVLYFYFDFNDIEKQEQEKMVRSLNVQLASQCASTSHALENLYSSCSDGQRQPTCDMLLESLHQMMRGLKETYIILDALDECLKGDELMTSIEELTSWKDASLHILATSRREKDIEEWMEPLVGDQEPICIQSRLVDNDIRAYIHDTLRTDRVLKKWNRQPLVLQEIEEKLMDKADGILVSLDSRTHNDMDGGDDSSYEGSEDLDDGSENLDDRNESLDGGIESLAHGSVNMNDKKNRDIIRLAHFSVKEYLVSNRILQGDARRFSVQETSANALICSDCLAYLLQFEGSYRDSQSLTKFPLALYAAEYWISHAQVAEGDTDFEPPLITELFLTKEAGLLKLIRLYRPHFTHAFFLASRMGSISTPLYYTALAGLHKSVQMLLDKGADVNAQGGYFGNALQAAAERGHNEVVQLLLDKGADVNAQGGFHGNALQAAAYRGHNKVVQLLLDKGADVNAQGGFHGNALQAAAEGGHNEVVQLLLDKGADVNAQGGFCGNALQAAARYGHNKLVQLLLDKGADVNAQGGFYGNALQAAATLGHNEVVQLLLKHGAIAEPP